MKFAVCTVAYNEAEYIGACINNWKGVVDKHLILVSAKPWNGSPDEDDGTYRIAKRMGADVVLGDWKTEHEQRTWGLARLWEYDYVLIVDADELYTKVDQEVIIEELNNPIRKDFTTNRYMPAFKAGKILTYFKTPEYVLSPVDNYKPIIAVDPKQTLFYEHRNAKPIDGSSPFYQYMTPIDITMYHFSYAKSDRKMKEKIQSFSHADIVHPSWYYDIWMKWKPGDITPVQPYGTEGSKAIFDPAPQELISLIVSSR